MYAIIETGGKQVKVLVDQPVYIEKVEGNVGDKVVFDKVLLVSDKETVIGAPYVAKAKVTAVIEKQGRGQKIVIFKYRPKKHSSKKQGHRQPYTKLLIKEITV